MTEIRFYHLQTQTLEEALPGLLGKAYASGKHILVKHEDAAALNKLNGHLWTFHPQKFLPHGSDQEPNKDLQPILLTTQDENPNNAKILILGGGTTHPDIGNFDLCCEMLDGHNEEAIKTARGRWKEYKDKGYTVTYWQQTETGGWEQKA